MPVVFLDCSHFRKEAEKIEGHSLECCPACHRNPDKTIMRDPFLITVKPYIDHEFQVSCAPDWRLGIEGFVCHTFYDIARSLPRDWWIEQARIHKADIFAKDGYRYPGNPSRDYLIKAKKEREDAQSPKAKVTRRRVIEEDGEVSFQDFLKGR